MQRRKPASAKQRKAQLQQKRAVKRGDISPPPPSKPDKHHRIKRGPTGQPLAPPGSSTAIQSARRLQSSFVKLPQSFLEDTKYLASNLPLHRPVPTGAAIFPFSENGVQATGIDSKSEPLTCPRRPKWRYEMTKKEVEKNEEGLFKKWLDQTDMTMNHCITAVTASLPDPIVDEEENVVGNGLKEMPRAPSSYERNLEVWRQLWRVSEISQILLILLDSRCPLLHYPPSLAAYLAAPHLARTRTILVLTKVDIAGPARTEAWTRYLKTHYPGIRVVHVESYIEKSAGEGAGKRKLYEPHLPTAFRQTLVETLRETHAELLEPPERVRNDAEKLSSWKPSVKQEINWQAVLNAQGGHVGNTIGGATNPRPREPQADIDDDEYQHDSTEVDPEYLTVGLIGQPNVGKSSLLNALFGTQKVRASRTPGKTKHFQTLFWTSELRLVDCPGLVMPNFVPMEMQVLSGILPISRVSAIPLCIYHAAQLLPLEHIYKLTHPALSSLPIEDKRTWRDGTRSREPMSEDKLVWTAMDILTAFALKKRWVTAKAGRPDVNRAGNSILRALAEGKLRWAFWPPDFDVAAVEAQQGEGMGIWMPHAVDAEDSDEDSADGDDAHRQTDDSNDPINEESGSDGEISVSEGDTNVRLTSGVGRFGALALDDAVSDDEDEDENTGDSSG